MFKPVLTTLFDDQTGRLIVMCDDHTEYELVLTRYGGEQQAYWKEISIAKEYDKNNLTDRDYADIIAKQMREG